MSTVKLGDINSIINSQVRVNITATNVPAAELKRHGGQSDGVETLPSNTILFSAPQDAEKTADTGYYSLLVTDSNGNVADFTSVNAFADPFNITEDNITGKKELSLKIDENVLSIKNKKLTFDLKTLISDLLNIKFIDNASAYKGGLETGVLYYSTSDNKFYVYHNVNKKLTLLGDYEDYDGRIDARLKALESYHATNIIITSSNFTYTVTPGFEKAFTAGTKIGNASGETKIAELTALDGYRFVESYPSSTYGKFKIVLDNTDTSNKKAYLYLSEQVTAQGNITITASPILSTKYAFVIGNISNNCTFIADTTSYYYNQAIYANTHVGNIKDIIGITDDRVIISASIVVNNEEQELLWTKIADGMYSLQTTKEFTFPANNIPVTINVSATLDDVVITANKESIVPGESVLFTANLNNVDDTPENQYGKLILSNELTMLPHGLFANNKDINYLLIPDSIKTIEDAVFANCGDDDTVIDFGNTRTDIPTIDTSTFVFFTGKIKVPASLLNSWKNAENWEDLEINISAN